MFSDLLALKTTMLFHTVWPAVDIIPYNSVAQSSLDASKGAAGNQNYFPVSSESAVSGPCILSAAAACVGHAGDTRQRVRSLHAPDYVPPDLQSTAAGVKQRRRTSPLLIWRESPEPACFGRRNSAPQHAGFDGGSDHTGAVTAARSVSAHAILWGSGRPSRPSCCCYAGCTAV